MAALWLQSAFRSATSAAITALVRVASASSRDRLLGGDLPVGRIGAPRLSPQRRRFSRAHSRGLQAIRTLDRRAVCRPLGGYVDAWVWSQGELAQGIDVPSDENEWQGQYRRYDRSKNAVRRASWLSSMGQLASWPRSFFAVMAHYYVATRLLNDPHRQFERILIQVLTLGTASSSNARASSRGRSESVADSRQVKAFRGTVAICDGESHC